ncbi:mucin-binding protein [Lactobacillus pasteurii]|uniref:Mub B2-like domain-containing protein n=1 Tax=Lactobacillus pasteurii DSM 23907 = CRBIP 24.76 TaxID=1423790 RepID=I7LEB2_9LACO|nr:BspA family leucine-rich repeat surface protein [Lactobacillus pasteurii]TDG75681.1 hypothetical protein C5L33_000566 [Lactobacillus pasteurii]CCI85638.1 Putative uncharacterized protein [Lactobacillus pasteurii DSM 23907 = CRBIP 24.76]
MTKQTNRFSLRKLTIGLVPVTFVVLAMNIKHVHADELPNEAAAVTEVSQPGAPPSEPVEVAEATTPETTEPVEVASDVETTPVDQPVVSEVTPDSSANVEATPETIEPTSTQSDPTPVETVNNASSTDKAKLAKPATAPAPKANQAAPTVVDAIDWDKVIYNVGDDLNVEIIDYTYEKEDLDKEWTVLLPNTYDFIEKGIIDKDHIATISDKTLRKIVVDRSGVIPGVTPYTLSKDITIKVSENGNGKLKLAGKYVDFSSPGAITIDTLHHTSNYESIDNKFKPGEIVSDPYTTVYRDYFPKEQTIPILIGNLKRVDLDHLDVSDINWTSFAFQIYLEDIKISKWDTRNMGGADFAYTSSLSEIDLSSWNTDKMTDFRFMFMETGARKINLNGWYGGGHSGLAEYAFRGSKKLTHLDLGNWRGKGPTNVSYMFGDLPSLKYLNISNWDWIRLCILDDNRVLQTSPNLEVLRADGFKNITWPAYYHMYLNTSSIDNKVEKLIDELALQDPSIYDKLRTDPSIINIDPYLLDPTDVPPLEEVNKDDQFDYDKFRNYFAFKSNHPLIIIAKDGLGDTEAWTDPTNPDLKRPTEIKIVANYVDENRIEELTADLERFIFPSVEFMDDLVDEKIKSKFDLTKYDITYTSPLTAEELEEDPATLIKKLTGTYYVTIKHKKQTKDESKTVQRIITVINPDNTKSETVQSATFTRQATTDLATGETTYTPYDKANATLAEFIPAAIDGYTPSLGKVDQLEVTPDSIPENVTITYQRVTNPTTPTPDQPTSPVSDNETPTSPEVETNTPEETTSVEHLVTDDKEDDKTKPSQTIHKSATKSSKPEKQTNLLKLSQKENPTSENADQASLPQTGEKQGLVLAGLSLVALALGILGWKKKSDQN